MYNIGDQLVSDGTTTYDYDADGYLRTKTVGTDVTTYTYDTRGRLKQVQTPTQTISYQHNAMGNRVAKLINGAVVEKYLWLDKTTLLATYNPDGTLKQRFEYTDGHVPDSYTEAGDTYYIVKDHLGSPRAITDSSGSVLRKISYDSFGNIITDTNSSLKIPFGFAGGLFDKNTGLIRFGYRDYDPQTGRWTSRDPIGFAAGDNNLYGYTFNDPIGFLDITGLDVTITLYHGAGGFGHIGIGVNSSATTGFYPTPTAGGLSVISGPVGGVRQSDNAPIRNTMTIPTTPLQDVLLQAAINYNDQSPGQYDFLSGNDNFRDGLLGISSGASKAPVRNCVTNARDLLNSAGIPASGSFLPLIFFNETKHMNGLSRNTRRGRR